MMLQDRVTLMNSKEIFRKALDLNPAERLPAAPHWWGMYKYEACGLDVKTAAWKDGSGLVPVYEGYYKKFKPDWFHLHIGTPKYFKDSVIEQVSDTARLRIDPSFRKLKSLDRYLSVDSGDDEDIIDFPDYLLGSRCERAKVDLESKASIDDFVSRYIYMSAEDIGELGYTDHVEIISKDYGGTVYIAVHIPSAICEIFDPHTGYLGFERGLIELYENPEGMKHLFARCYEAQLEWAKAYAQAGAHGYAISESFISPDIAGEDVWRSFMKGIHTEHFAEIARYGIDPICMFWGDVNSHIEDFTEINIKGLMLEESKKTFHLDIKEIREKIGGRLCLFGNIDSITLLKEGRPEDVRDSVIEQIDGAERGFIIANGSPIVPGTPSANVTALIDTISQR
jgi:hypothetical protein